MVVAKHLHMHDELSELVELLVWIAIAKGVLLEILYHVPLLRSKLSGTYGRPVVRYRYSRVISNVSLLFL